MKLFNIINNNIYIFNKWIKADSNEILINLKKGGKLIFIRHAYAPGGGDPDNFDLKRLFDTKKFK